MQNRDRRRTSSTPLLEVYKDNLNNLTKFAVRLTGCYSYAEDIVQETFFRLPSNLKNNPSGKAKLGYILQIIKNLSIDHHRKQKLINKNISYTDTDLPLDNLSPEIIHTDSCTINQIDKLLAQLPARTRYAFEQHRIHGISQKMIAKELGVSNTLVNFMVRDALAHCCKSIE